MSRTHAWPCHAMNTRMYQAASPTLPKALKAMAKVLKEREEFDWDNDGVTDVATTTFYSVEDAEWYVTVVVAD